MWLLNVPDSKQLETGVGQGRSSCSIDDTGLFRKARPGLLSIYCVLPSPFGSTRAKPRRTWFAMSIDSGRTSSQVTDGLHVSPR